MVLSPVLKCVNAVLWPGYIDLFGTSQNEGSLFKTELIYAHSIHRLMRGLILAAGRGTRLQPVSFPISKILLPVYNKPMIYYPLSTLMIAGIKDILVITNKEDLENFKRTLGDGSQFGLRISYEIQHEPRGIADAFIVGEEFIAGDDVILALGDNIFHGCDDVQTCFEEVSRNNNGATIFAYAVDDPERFGVVEFDGNGNALSLEEKPQNPKSNYAVIGLYFYDHRVSEFAKKLSPSKRGELEITDLNRMYLELGALKVHTLCTKHVWRDAGTFESLHEASSMVRDIESDGSMICCPELIALEQGFVDRKTVEEWIGSKDNEYYAYIRERLDEFS